MARLSPSETSLPLTSDVLRSAYEYLCSTTPFCKWNMPDADDIVFKVDASRRTWGQARYYVGRKKPQYEIRVSSFFIGRTDSLMALLAHEMIHIHQRETKMDKGSEHNTSFKKLAAKVCMYHGFDPKIF